jgi:hypothetical protein
VTVSFNEELAAASVDASAFALDGGVTVLNATLQPDQKTVNLLTTLLPENTALTLAVSAVRDLAGNRIATTALAVSAQALPSEIVANVGALANGYKLVYSLDIPLKGNFVATPDFYRYSQPNFAPPFDRIAYYMELQPLDGDLTYLWVSMDPFTGDINKIGVPVRTTGETFQKNVSNMNVACNDPSVTTGTGLAGNLEFWPSNYANANAVGAGVGPVAEVEERVAGTRHGADPLRLQQLGLFRRRHARYRHWQLPFAHERGH